MKIQNTPSKFAIRALGIVSASLLAFACSGDDGEEAPADVAPAAAVQPPPDQAPVQPIVEAEAPAEPAAPVDPIVEDVIPEAEEIDNSADNARDLAITAAQSILQVNCGGCHGQAAINRGDISGNFDYIEDLDELQRNGKLLVGNSAASPIVQLMRNNLMPPDYVALRPSAQDIETIAQFIDNPLYWPDVVINESCVDTNRTKTFDNLWEQIQSDLLRQDADDQPFMRYVTLQNKFNAGVCADREMDLYRNGLNKALNSLSDQAQIQRAEAIDPEELTYRIDIRDYGWDEPVNVDNGVVLGGAFNDKWEAIVGLSPFAVQFEGDQADQVRFASETDIPMIYADALIDVAQIGNLYYALVNVPNTLDELLQDLQVDRERDQEQKREFRAGTTRSIVSRQDRTVTRNVINVGGNRGFYQSFDFEANQQSDSIFLDVVEFEFDNSEAIFALNNGLLAYVIYDGDGNRLEESEILLDRTQNDFRARTAVSCSGCHAAGLLEVQDEVAEFAQANLFSFNNEEFEFINDLYDQDEFDRNYQADNDSYQNALSRTGTPLNITDPIQDVFISFDSDLGLNEVAGDIGVNPQLLQNELSRLDPSLQVVRSATIDRDDFTEVFQATICVMQNFSRNRPDEALCDGFINDLEL